MTYSPNALPAVTPQATADAMAKATHAMMAPMLQGLGMWSDMLRAGQPKPKPPSPMDLMQAWWHTPTAFAGGFMTGLARPAYGEQPLLPFAAPSAVSPATNPFAIWTKMFEQSIAAAKPAPRRAEPSRAEPYSTYRSFGGHATAQIADPLTESVIETTRAAMRLQSVMWPFALWQAPRREAAE